MMKRVAIAAAIALAAYGMLVPKVNAGGMTELEARVANLEIRMDVANGVYTNTEAARAESKARTDKMLAEHKDLLLWIEAAVKDAQEKTKWNGIRSRMNLINAQ